MFTPDAPARYRERCDKAVLLAACVILFLFSSAAQRPEKLAAAIPPSDVIEKLRRDIEFGTAEEKRSALFEIRNYQHETVSRIALPALRDRDEVVRATAAAAVVYLPDEEAARALSPLLADRSPFVRREAAYSLDRSGSPFTVEPLIATLRNDKDREVRAAAAHALGSSRSLAAVAMLAELLRSRPISDEEFIRRSAARSIGRLAEFFSGVALSTAIPSSFLPEKFKDLPEFERDDLAARYPIFGTAANVLSAVLRNTAEEPDTRREAAFAIGSIANPPSATILRSCSRSEDPYLAETCLEALIRRKNPE